MNKLEKKGVKYAEIKESKKKKANRDKKFWRR